jgi:hypothetical protein
MRRHVLRVGCGRRDLGIALCGVEAFLGEDRRIVKVDKVVRDARMPRLALEDSL